METPQKPIALTLGDPSGIGTEVVFKALAEKARASYIIFGDWNLTRQALEHLRLEPQLQIERTLPQTVTSPRLFIDIAAAPDATLAFGHVSPASGRVAMATLDAAVGAVMNGSCRALVTAPIHKRSIHEAGFEFPGHTEYLAARTERVQYGRDYAMYFDSPLLKVVLLTVHLPLRHAIEALEVDLVRDTILLTSREYLRIYGSMPRIGVAGVNPHAGEGGLFGEEESILAEGISQARSAGIEVTGPHSPDTIFLQATRGRHDLVIAAYHDQGLIAVKTLDFDHSVNVTIGLPFLRCSVDHGTAFDIAGKGIADPAPMRYALEWAERHSVELAR